MDSKGQGSLGRGTQMRRALRLHQLTACGQISRSQHREKKKDPTGPALRRQRSEFREAEERSCGEEYWKEGSCTKRKKKKGPDIIRVPLSLWLCSNQCMHERKLT